LSEYFIFASSCNALMDHSVPVVFVDYFCVCVCIYIYISSFQRLIYKQCDYFIHHSILLFGFKKYF